MSYNGRGRVGLTLRRLSSRSRVSWSRSDGSVLGGMCSCGNGRVGGRGRRVGCRQRPGRSCVNARGCLVRVRYRSRIFAIDSQYRQHIEKDDKDLRGLHDW